MFTVRNLITKAFIALTALLFLPGCHTGIAPVGASRGDNPGVPAKSAQKAASDAASAHARDWTPLISEGWFLAPESEELRPADVPYRWRHTGVEAFVAKGRSQQGALKQAMRQSDPVLVVNAAIALARLGLADEFTAVRLAEAVQASDLKLPVRRAAAEALGLVDDPGTIQLLDALLDQFACKKTAHSSQEQPELHEELLLSLAHCDQAVEDPRLVESLSSSSADVRLAALEICHELMSVNSNWPEEAIALIRDGDPRLRSTALAALAARQPQAAKERLELALRDERIEVRLAAVKGLSQLHDESSITTLKKLLEDRAEAVRAAAVTALAQHGVETEVLEAAGDDSWRVRLAVAESLQGFRSPAATAIVERLLKDPSLEVARHAVEALADWPLETAGPILLSTLDSPIHSVRQAAAEQLAERWNDAAGFAADAAAAQREKVAARLREAWQEQFGQIDPARLAAAWSSRSEAVPAADERTVRRVEALLVDLTRARGTQGETTAISELTSLGERLVPALEAIALDHSRPLPAMVYTQVLPAVREEFRLLDDMTQQDSIKRQHAASQLARIAVKKPLGRLAVSRLSELMQSQTDPLVWRSILEGLANDTRREAVQIVYASLSQPEAEVRRRGCEYLDHHPDPKNVRMLLPALEDASLSVVRAAIHALGHPETRVDARQFEQFLTSTDSSLRLEAAAALTRQGDPRGHAALERLALDSDRRVRCAAAEHMGASADSRFVPTLLAMLDDPLGDVRHATHAALVKTAGRDITQVEGEPLPDGVERVRRWREWWAQQNGNQDGAVMPASAEQ